jgi:hypothetical protein
MLAGMNISSSPFASLLAAGAVAAVLAGCDTAASGALGQSSISQGCAGSTLPCAGASDLQAPLAVGTSVDLSVDLELQGGGEPPIQLVSTEPSVFTVAQQTLTGVSPGRGTLLLVSEENVVLDFVAMWVQEPASLAVSRLSADGADLGEVPGELGLVVGDSVSVAVSTLSLTEPLSGRPKVAWSVADPSVASVVDAGVLGVGSVVARAPGSTQVTASALGLETSFAVEVTP